MNTELKALIDCAWSLGNAVNDAAVKHDMSKAMVDASGLLTAVPSAISNWSGLKAEIDALPGTAQEADLLAYITAKATGLGLSVKAESILAASLAWAEKTYELVKAISAKS